MVFTIVTIIFLPPTFVATFFGMHIFDADTIGTAQKTFWLVLGALLGGIYVLAALGLFGTNISTERQQRWGASLSRIDIRETISALTDNIATWFENTQRLIREKMAHITHTLDPGPVCF
ncbi:hypothetical protein F5Y09DRAFT_311941 [Xylaria sp. FL1042]|nr:hypothetical protein F5Y09DRAFT_311941 [Xylaria sp. FL1042]